MEKFINDTGHIQYREGIPSSDAIGILQNNRHIRLGINGKPVAVLDAINGVDVFISADNIPNLRESGKSEMCHRLGSSRDECHVEQAGFSIFIHGSGSGNSSTNVKDLARRASGSE